jgi:uncharacterized protein YndB with AHSA1/START domain
MTQSKNLTIVRTLNAPQDLVWHAWSDPEHFKKWWGPKEFSCSVAKIEFRVGGKFLANMIAADGNVIWSLGIYKVIDPKTKIVFSDFFANEKGDIVTGAEYGMPEVTEEMTVTVLFKDVNGKTEMTIIHEGLPDAHYTGANTGWNTSIDKLEESFQ